MNDDEIYDVAVVGGGPAGLTAAMFLARYLHRVVLIDSGDPRNWETRGVHGFLGQPDAKPAELRRSGREECRRYGVRLVDDFVSRVEQLKDDHFVLQLAGAAGQAATPRAQEAARRLPEGPEESGHPSKFEARRVLLAIGIKDRWPSIPGLRQVYGETAHVCPDCDGYEARRCKIVVIGAGIRAATMALALTTWTNDIVVCTNGEPPDLTPEMCSKLQALNIPVLTACIERANSVDGVVRSLDLEDGMCLDCQRLFFTIGQRPPHPMVDVPSDPADPPETEEGDLGTQLGCEREGERGSIRIDEHFRTSVSNVYAAGDITPGPQLAIRAASSGAVAAMVIHKSLVPAQRKLE
jgi:thioredoxin reductase